MMVWLFNRFCSRLREIFLALFLLLPMVTPLTCCLGALLLDGKGVGIGGGASMQWLLVITVASSSSGMGGSISSMMAGIGVLLQVWRWWTCRVRRIIVRDVALMDVDGTFTLCDAVACTL